MAQAKVQPHSERPIPGRLVKALYEHAGWWPERTEAAINQVLRGAPAVGAWVEGRLVGFARVVTDGLFRAYVEDVVVHSDYRHQGIGAALVARLVGEVSPTVRVSLFCKSGLVPLYERQGFTPTIQVVMHRADAP